MKDEKTSKKVAAIAGRVLQAIKTAKLRDSKILCGIGPYSEVLGHQVHLIVTVRDLKALAASCLTQSPDRPKPIKRHIPVETPKAEGKRK